MSGSAGKQRFVEDIVAGMALPPLVKRPTATMLFRFSAVTWNAHRVHYDEPHARSEGHAGVLVQATMHGAFVLQMLNGFAGAGGRVLAVDYANRGRAYPGDVLTVSGIVTGVDLDEATVACEVIEQNQDGLVCVKGTARVALPRRPAGAPPTGG